MAAEKLTALVVKNLNTPGMYGDGKGLWLRVKDTGAKSWVFRYTVNGKARTMGLGPYPEIGLADAREKAIEQRRQLLKGVDPLAAKEQAAAEAVATALLDKARMMTFDQCAEKYIDAHRAGWKNPKHVQQWENTLSTYASPKIGALPVAAIDNACVLQVLEPIWKDKNETASRLRGRIESILDWATVRGYRQGLNPARWKGQLDKLLPAPAKVQKNEHHAALPYAQMHSFIQALRKQEGIGRLAFEFCILTATRTSETLNARWEEIDEATRLWTVPKERMKAGKEHVIPLSDRCMSLLSEVRALGSGEGFIFPGRGDDKPLSNMTFLMTLRRMKRDDLTAHGFRSTFRDWAGETTAYPREVIEHAMAHQLKDKAEAAYARGTLLDKRRRLMADWASYCEQEPAQAGEVVPIRGKAAA